VKNKVSRFYGSLCTLHVLLFTTARTLSPGSPFPRVAFGIFFSVTFIYSWPFVRLPHDSHAVCWPLFDEIM